MKPRDKKILTGLAVAGGILLLSRKARPAIVRGQDPGFDWQGQHVQGGQGSAITNVGAPKEAKTDYVLVATAMKNYALNTVKTYGGTDVPGVPLSYAMECIDYWYNEAGRLLAAGPTSKSLGTALTIVTLGTAEQLASKKDPFNQTRGFWKQSSPLTNVAFDEVFREYKAFHDRIPSSIYLRWGLRRTMGVPAPYEFVSVTDARAFWDAILRVGIGFDVSKSVPTENALWAPTIAALKKVGGAVGGATKTAITTVGRGAGAVIGAAGKGLASAILSSPTAMIVVGGLGYLVYRRYARRTA